MLGVILLHYNGAPGHAMDAVVPGSLNFYIIFTLENLFVCAVDLFLLISGFFLCTGGRRSGWKALELIIQVILYAEGVYLLRVLLHLERFSVSGVLMQLVPDNYFVILYVTVYLLSPYLNLLARGLAGKGKTFRTCLILMGALFSVWTLVTDLGAELLGAQWQGISTIAMQGSQNGYTIVNFVMMYLIGAYLRLDRTESRPTGKLLAAFIGNAVILTGASAAAKLQGLPITEILWAYCNPLVMVNAVLIFQLFRQLKMPAVKWINTLASGAFSVYLLHAMFLQFARVPWAAEQNAAVLLGHMALTAAAIYLLCWCAHMVYHWVTEPVFRALRKRFPLLLPETGEA